MDVRIFFRGGFWLGVAINFFSVGCLQEKAARVVPALEYSQSVKDGIADKFSFFDIAKKRQDELKKEQELKQSRSISRGAFARPTESDQDSKRSEEAAKSTEVKLLSVDHSQFLKEGYEIKKTIQLPETQYSKQLEEQALGLRPVQLAPQFGSSAPYYRGQMRANPSLWPDESQQSSLFRDLRAFQPMDVVTIVVNEAVEGQKRTQTDSQSRFTILAAVENLFNFLGSGTGENAAKWVSNNAGIDPENLINAQTNSVYQGTGQTKRLGSLRGKLSAMVLEVLPNGLLRLEGTKIVAVDQEEEVMVISGLARLRDIDSANQIDSSRIANMRIDFYGKGVVGDVTDLGWGTRLIRGIWPF